MVRLASSSPCSQASDAKTANALGAGAIVLGLAGLGTVDDARALVLGLLLAALAAFAVLAALALWQLWPSGYLITDDDTVWENQWTGARDDVMHALVVSAAEAFAHNHRLAEEKARRLCWALIALAVEVALGAGAVAATALAG